MRATIDGGAGADLNVILDDDAAELRDFEMTFCTHHEAKSILTDFASGMDDDAVADERVVIDEPAPMEQSRPIRTCGPITALAAMTVPRPYFGPRTDDRPGIDGHAVFKPRCRMNMRAGNCHRSGRATTVATRRETCRARPVTKAR